MNGVGTTVTFDPTRPWVKTIQAGVAGVLLNLTYTYDTVGNVTGIVDPRPGMTQLFTYDELDRLAVASGIHGPLTFGYDPHGNRTGPNYTYAAGNPFKLESFAGGSLGYDANGNLTSAPQSIYTYTANNLMASATVGGTPTTFAYDADDWRVKKVAGSTTTYYLRGPSGQLLTEWATTGSTSAIRDYVYAGSRLITVAVSETTAP